MASTGSELELVAPDRTYRLDAESMEHAERWLVALCEATGAGGGAGGGAAGTTAGSTATAACTATATATDVTSGLGPSSRSSDQTQAHGLPDTSVDERVLLERARYLVQRTQQAQQEEFVVDARADVFAVVVDEVALRNRPSHRGSVVVGKAVRGDRLHVQATQDAWARLDNNNWTEITNGSQTFLVPERELHDFLQLQPNALRPRQATTINFQPGKFEGWMLKKGEVRQSWKCRYFVLTTGISGSKLRYYEEGAAHEVPRKHLGTIDFADCYSVSSAGDGSIEIIVNAVSVHNKHQARPRRKAGDQQQESSTRKFEVIPVASKVAHVSSGRPCLDPDEQRLELAERWLQACSAAMGDSTGSRVPAGA